MSRRAVSRCSGRQPFISMTGVHKYKIQNTNLSDGQAARGVDPRSGSQRPGGFQSSSSPTRSRHDQLLTLDKEGPLPLPLQRHLVDHHREPARDEGHQEERVVDAEQLAGGAGDVPAQVVDVPHPL